MGEALLSGLRFAWWLSSDLLWWTVSNRCHGVWFLLLQPRGNCWNSAAPRGVNSGHETQRDVWSIIFMVLFWNHRLDLTVEQLLSTCNMSFLDMSCLNPWPFHPLTNALLNGFFFSLNKSLLLTPESVYSQRKGEVFGCLGDTAAVFGVYQPTAGVCCPHSPDLVRTEVVVLQICQLLKGSNPEDPNWSGLGKPPPPCK